MKKLILSSRWRYVLFLICLLFVCHQDILGQSYCPSGSIVYTKLGERQYQFSFSNTQAVNDYFWDFGDGTYSEEANPIHSFLNEPCNVNINFQVKVQLNNCMEKVSNGNFQRFFTQEQLINLGGSINTNPTVNCTCPVCYNTPSDLLPLLPNSYENVFGFYTEHLYRYEWGIQSCDRRVPQPVFANTFRVKTGNTVTTGNTRVNYGDHTLGNNTINGNLLGSFLIIDGKDNNANVRRTISWAQRIKINPDKIYRFSCWVKNVTGATEIPKVDFGILTGFDYSVNDTEFQFLSMFLNQSDPANKPTYNGSIIVVTEEGEGIAVPNQEWMEMVGTFKTTAGQEYVDIAVVSYSHNPSGNDLGVDDISLREVCNPELCPVISTLIPKEECLPPCTACPASFQPVPGKEYILSAWVKEDQSSFISTYTNAGIQLSFSTSGADAGTTIYSPSGPITEGWQRIEQKFIVPAASTGIKITLKGVQGLDIYYDDIRIHPVDASMKSYVYDPETLRLMAELDENNYATFYEYDQEGKLLRLKKETERGTMTVQESTERLFKR